MPDGIFYDNGLPPTNELLGGAPDPETVVPFQLPTQHGPVRPWKDPQTHSLLTDVVFWQREEFWQPAVIGTSQGRPDGVTGFLIGESTPSPIGGDLLEWVRTYADLPDYRFEPSETVATAQVATYDLLNSKWVLRELSLLTTGLMVFDYLYEEDIEGGIQAIELFRPTRYYVSGEGATLYTIAGTTFPVTGVPWTEAENFPEDHIVLEQSAVSRWREGGNIIERRTLLANTANLNLGELVPPP